MKRFAFLLTFAFLAFAATAEEPARIQAHPATWQVKGKHGSAVLFGSQHILPKTIDWLSPELEKTVADADVLVFEIPLDAGTSGTFLKMITARGSLPSGQTLRSLLPPDEVPAFDKALAAAGLPESAVSNKRPWLAAFLFESMIITKQMKDAAMGPDFVLTQKAQKDKKELRYLETAEQQLALLAPEDPELEMQFFLSIIHDAAEADSALDEMSDAWAKGDVARLDGIIEKSFTDLPAYKARFFTDRNKAMAKKIAEMLKENKKFLIVVGAGHLVGTEGIPALLCAKGFKVSGP